MLIIHIGIINGRFLVRSLHKYLALKSTFIARIFKKKRIELIVSASIHAKTAISIGRNVERQFNIKNTDAKKTTCNAATIELNLNLPSEAKRKDAIRASKNGRVLSRSNHAVMGGLSFSLKKIGAKIAPINASTTDKVNNTNAINPNRFPKTEITFALVDLLQRLSKIGETD
jgi:hypothetical protein